MKHADIHVGLGLRTAGGLPRTLRGRFLVPPFSVLDARQAYWQERKRAWLSIGLRGEIGRGNQLTYRGGRASLPRGAAPTDENDFREKMLAPGGTSVFDPVLCELAYTWFCPAGGAVLDPFAGGSVRGVVAVATGRRYLGVDLSEPQVVANFQQWSEVRPKLPPEAYPPKWIVGDARDLGRLAPPALYDCVFSCPPYYDLEKYSKDPRDLSNMSYPNFLTSYRAIVAACLDLLRDDRFAAFVIGDVRGEDGYYRDLVGETVRAFAAAGGRLYNQAVLVTMTATLGLRTSYYFTKSRKLGTGHQHLLIFAKGDAKKAVEACEPT